MSDTKPAWRGVDLASRWAPNMVVLTTAIVVAVVWWARDRGFDLTDEGYYLQLYAHPEAAPPNAAVSQYYRLVDLGNGPAEFGIVGYRIAGLVLLLLAGGFLALAVYRFVARFLPHLTSALPSRAVGVAFVLVSGLLGYAWAPLAISYNTIATALAQIAAGLVLLALVAVGDAASTSRSVMLAAAVGLLIPLLFYVKWPVAVLLSIVLAMFSVIVVGRAAGRLLMTLGATMAIGFAVFTEEILGGIFSFGEMLDGIGRITAGGYEPAALVADYAFSLVAEMVRVIVHDPVRLVALLALFAGPALIGMLQGRAGRIPTWLLPAMGAVYLIAEIPGASYLHRATDFKFVVAVFVALGIGAFAVRTISAGELPELSIAKMSRQGVVLGSLVLLLLGLPLVVAFGSNSYILISSLHGGAGYGAAMIVGLAGFGSLAKDGGGLRHGVVLPVLAIVIAAQVINGVVVDPYRLASPRTEQSELVDGVSRLAGVRFDAASARFLDDVHRIVAEETSFESGDQVLAFATIPGLIYMIDGVSQGALWILPIESEDQGEICPTLQIASAEVAGTTLLLQNQDPSPELTACLAEIIPGYPDDFVEAGRTAIPDGYGDGIRRGATLRVLELGG